MFFRKGCAEEARRLGVAGFVRNSPEGGVEAAFEGPEADVDAMVLWCRRGTDWADVEAVEVAEEQPKGGTGFTIEH